MIVVNPESSFRINTLVVTKHPILGNIHITFNNDVIQEEIDRKEIYTTVIIGPNGIGKSYLLKILVDIFNYVYLLNNTNETPRSLGYYFDIDYWYNGLRFRINNTIMEGIRINSKAIDKLSCYINNERVGLNSCLLPNVVVASAMTITDKFPIKPIGEMYRYQGVRSENSPSTTGTRTLIRKTVQGLIKCLNVKGGFREELKMLLDVLGFQHFLKIQYQIKYKKVLLDGNLNPELLCSIFENKDKEFFKRDSDLWGKKYFDKEVKGDIGKLESICEFYRHLAGTLDIRKSRLSITYDVFEQEIEHDADVLLLLSKLDLISFPTLLVSKRRQYDFANSSSGETHLLCQMIGIMSDIKKGGLVLIDEPETSSHPNWQIHYIEWIKKIFKDYYSCHFIVSTHSHFLLSDLEKGGSTIIALDKDENGLKNIGEGLNTFCWSTDDILYSVFHVRNTRNRVFEEKVANLYNKISKGDKDFDTIKQLINELSVYQLPSGDPLRKLIKNAMKYVETN